MKRPLIALAALTLASHAWAQDADAPQIAVTGEATVSVAPDTAVIEAGVATDAKTAKEASDAANTVVGKVLLALESAGIDRKDMQTQRLSLQPQYAQRNNNGPSVITGYRASNRVSVRLRDLTLVARSLDLALSAGANEIGGVSFTVAEPSRLLDEARTKAIADARRKADIYAKAVGVDLGAPLGVTEQGAAPAVPMFRRMAAGMAATAPQAIAQGEETLHVAVSVSWAIKPKQP